MSLRTAFPDADAIQALDEATQTATIAQYLSVSEPPEQSPVRQDPGGGSLQDALRDVLRRPKLKKAPVSLEQLEKNARELRMGSGTKKPSPEMDLLTNALLNRRPAMDDQFEEDDDTDSRDQSDEAWK
jgi:hypothetical protein